MSFCSQFLKLLTISSIEQRLLRSLWLCLSLEWSLQFAAKMVMLFSVGCKDSAVLGKINIDILATQPLLEGGKRIG